MKQKIEQAEFENLTKRISTFSLHKNTKQLLPRNRWR